MKTVNTLKNDRQYIEVECTECKIIIKRNKSTIKKHNPFCSEQCIQKHKDPKQYEIMNHENTPNFHYLVGLISTDGHIAYPGCTTSVKSYRCNIKLKDEGILKNIQNIFGGSLGKEGKDKKTNVWGVGNKEFIKYLQSIGLTNRKTYNLDVSSYFNTLTKENKQAFIRGTIDGDGCISIISRKTNGMRCGSYICSASKPFIEMIESYFNNGILTEVTKEKQNSYEKANIKANTSLYYYYMNGKRVIENLKQIYNVQPGDLYLKRKYAKYKAIEAYYDAK